MLRQPSKAPGRSLDLKNLQMGPELEQVMRQMITRREGPLDAAQMEQAIKRRMEDVTRLLSEVYRVQVGRTQRKRKAPRAASAAGAGLRKRA